MLQFFDAIHSGDLESAKGIFEREVIDLNTREPRTGLTPLWIATRQQNADMIMWLHGACADMDAHSGGHGAAIHAAARQNNNKILRILLGLGVAVSTEDARGWTPLEYAVSRLDARAVKALLSAGSDPNHKTHEDMTPLTMATKSTGSLASRLDIVNALLQHGAKVDAVTTWGETALMEACRHPCLELVRALLAANADVNLRDAEDRTAWNTLTTFGMTDIEAYGACVAMLAKYQSKKTLKRTCAIMHIWNMDDARVRAALPDTHV